MDREVLEKKLPGTKRASPTRTYLDVMKEDMQEVGPKEGGMFERTVHNIEHGAHCSSVATLTGFPSSSKV